MEHFTAARLYQLRLLAAWSRERLARELQLSSQTIYQWERGKRPIPYASGLALEQVLGAQIARLADVELGSLPPGVKSAIAMKEGKA